MEPCLIFYFEAWRVLESDRHYGAMGGIGRIYYQAISTYARDHRITGDDFALFLKLLYAIDETYVEFENKRQREEMERKSKQRDNQDPP